MDTSFLKNSIIGIAKSHIKGEEFARVEGIGQFFLENIDDSSNIINLAFKELLNETPDLEIEWGLIDLFEAICESIILYKPLVLREIEEHLISLIGSLDTNIQKALSKVGYSPNNTKEQLKQFFQQFETSAKARIVSLIFKGGKTNQYLIRDTFMTFLVSAEEKESMLNTFINLLKSYDLWNSKAEQIIDLIKMAPIKRAVTARITKKPIKQFWMLVIEENDAERIVLKKVVEREGHLPIDVKSGKKGIGLVSIYKPIIIISDLKFSDFNSIELISKLHKLEKKPFFIGITDDPQIANEIELKAYENKKILFKPIDTNELAKFIRDYINVAKK